MKFFGDPFLSVVHGHIRNNYSDLNYDLFRNNLQEDPSSSCNNIDVENSEHHLFKCPFYKESRVIHFRETRPFNRLNVETLLLGWKTLTQEDKKKIFLAVQHYNKESKRFKWIESTTFYLYMYILYYFLPNSNQCCALGCFSPATALPPKS